MTVLTSVEESSTTHIDRRSTVLCGVDQVHFATFKRTLQVGGEEFLEEVYTDHERAYCNERRNRTKHLAGRFAAKEAISKALGTGIRGIEWREMEIVHEENGSPHVRLHGQAAILAAELAIISWSISLSYCRTLATAFVVAISA